MLISELGSSQSMAQQAEANEKLEPQNAPMPELQSADAGSRKPEAGSVLDRTSKDGRSTDTETATRRDDTRQQAGVIARGAGGSSPNNQHV